MIFERIKQVIETLSHFSQPRIYSEKAYNQDKKEIFEDIKTWAYSFDAKKLTPIAIEKTAVRMAEAYLDNLVRIHIQHMEFEHNLIFLKKYYYKSPHFKAAWQEMKRAVTEHFEICLPVTRTVIDKIKDGISKIEAR
jgi:hypothetical protein